MEAPGRNPCFLHSPQQDQSARHPLAMGTKIIHVFMNYRLSWLHGLLEHSSCWQMCPLIHPLSIFKAWLPKYSVLEAPNPNALANALTSSEAICQAGQSVMFVPRQGIGAHPWRRRIGQILNICFLPHHLFRINTSQTRIAHYISLPQFNRCHTRLGKPGPSG